MSTQFVLAPLFVQVALTFALVIGMGVFRRQALVDKKVRIKDIALREPNWPVRATQFSNSYLNQFEAPVLFYVVVILAWFTKQADLLFVLLSWIYVVLRILQAYVHTTSNYVPRRGLAFLSSMIVLLVMWVIFALRIFLF